eukprot:4890205-Prymnesium_polylepis.1
MSLITTGGTGAADGWLVAHLFLAATSLQFRVPAAGHMLDEGYITNEVRAHTVVFTLRQVTLIVLHTALDRLWASPVVPPFACGLACLPFHLMVDRCTACLGSSGFSSVRGSHREVPFRSGAESTIRGILSALQFVNNHVMLFSGERVADVAFIGLAILQLNAFLMTLRKKQLISPSGLLHAYFVLLSVATSVELGWLACSPAHSVAIGTALYWLRRRGAPKYVLWCAAVAIGEPFSSVRG